MNDLPTTGGRWLMTKSGQLRRYPDTDSDDAGEIEPPADDETAPEAPAPETPAGSDVPAKSKGKP